VTLHIVASLIDATRGVIYDHHMFIEQATGIYIQFDQNVLIGIEFDETKIEKKRQKKILKQIQFHDSFLAAIHE
jgi:hypothetical protein